MAAAQGNLECLKVSAFKNCVLFSHLTWCIYFTFQVLFNAENKAEINALATAVDKSGILRNYMHGKIDSITGFFCTEFTVLYLAIVKQCNDCAKYLISQLGAKGVGQFNESGVTASHIAASAGMLHVTTCVCVNTLKNDVCTVHEA